MVAVVDDDAPQLVALAPELRAEIVRWVLTDREIKPLAIQRHPASEIEGGYLTFLRSNTLNWRVEDRDVQNFELIQQVLLHIGLFAICADDDRARPRRESESHTDRFPSFPDYYRFPVAGLVSIAIRAHVYGFAVALIQAGDVGADIFEADRQQNSAGFDRRPGVEVKSEQLTGFVQGVLDHSIHEGDAEALALPASDRPQLGRANTLVAEVAVDASGLPVPRIPRVGNDNFVEISR